MKHSPVRRDIASDRFLERMVSKKLFPFAGIVVVILWKALTDLVLTLPGYIHIFPLCLAVLFFMWRARRLGGFYLKKETSSIIMLGVNFIFTTGVLWLICTTVFSSILLFWPKKGSAETFYCKISSVTSNKVYYSFKNHSHGFYRSNGDKHSLRNNFCVALEVRKSLFGLYIVTSEELEPIRMQANSEPFVRLDLYPEQEDARPFLQMYSVAITSSAFDTLIILENSSVHFDLPSKEGMYNITISSAGYISKRILINTSGISTTGQCPNLLKGAVTMLRRESVVNDSVFKIPAARAGMLEENSFGWDFDYINSRNKAAERVLKKTN